MRRLAYSPTWAMPFSASPVRRVVGNIVHGWWSYLASTVTPRDLDQVDRWFEHWGAAAVLVCRMIPGIRTLISVPAGLFDRATHGAPIDQPMMGSAEIGSS